MNNILILAIGAAAFMLFKHGPIVRALLKLEFSYSAMDIIKVEADNIKAAVLMKVTNTTGTAVTIENIEAGLALNTKLIGLMNSPLTVPVPANGHNFIKINFDISKSKTGAELWSMILNKQTDFIFEISGKVTANGTKYPLSLTWTMKDIIQLING